MAPTQTCPFPGALASMCTAYAVLATSTGTAIFFYYDDIALDTAWIGRVLRSLFLSR